MTRKSRNHRFNHEAENGTYFFFFLNTYTRRRTVTTFYHIFLRSRSTVIHGKKLDEHDEKREIKVVGGYNRCIDVTRAVCAGKYFFIFFTFENERKKDRGPTKRRG